MTILAQAPVISLIPDLPAADANVITKKSILKAPDFLRNTAKNSKIRSGFVETFLMKVTVLLFGLTEQQGMHAPRIQGYKHNWSYRGILTDKGALLLANNLRTEVELEDNLPNSENNSLNSVKPNQQLQETG